MKRKSWVSFFSAIALLIGLSWLVGLTPAQAATAPQTTAAHHAQSSQKQVPLCSDVHRKSGNGECFTPNSEGSKTATPKSLQSRSATANSATPPPGCVSDATATATEITMTACSYTEGESHVGVTADVRAKIRGRDQVSWMHPHHATPATPALIRHAPLVHTNASMTSKTLWRLSGHEKYVRIVGDWRNDGRLGHIKAGFVAHASLPGDIMVFNTKSHKYEHGYTLKRPGTLTKDDQQHFLFWAHVMVHGSLVKVAVIQSCFNDFHGHVDVMVVRPVQVESEGKVLHNDTVHASSAGEEHVEGQLVCASGTLSGWATVAASGSADTMVSAMLMYLEKAVGDASVSLLAQARANAQAGYQSVAFAQIHLQCSDTPPPSQPGIKLTPGACVAQGQSTGVVSYVATNGDSKAHNGTVSIDAKGAQDQPVAIPAASSVSGQFTGLSSGTFHVTLTLDNGQTASDSVTIQPCPVAAPDVTLDTMNQVIETKSATTGLGVQVYGGDTATVTIATLWGQITTTKTFNDVSGSWNTTIGYTAPGEIPDGSQSFSDTPAPPAGYDQVHVVVVDNQTGKKVVTSTNVKITPFVPAP